MSFRVYLLVLVSMTSLLSFSLSLFFKKVLMYLQFISCCSRGTHPFLHLGCCFEDVKEMMMMMMSGEVKGEHKIQLFWETLFCHLFLCPV